MNVSELFDLTHWVHSEIEEAGIPKLYKALFNAIQQARNQPNQPFNDQREQLETAIKQVPVSRLSMEQLTFLENLGIASNVGKAGNQKIEDVLTRNVIDVATAATKINEMLTSLNEGINKSNQIRAGLEDVVEYEQYELEGEVLMRVVFESKSRINNIVDLKDQSNTWHDISRGISMAHEGAPQDVRVLGATNGSIIIELGVVSAIAGSFSYIVLSALKIADKSLDILKKAEELRALKLSNKKLISDLEKEAESEKNKGIEALVVEHAEELKIKQKGDGERYEALERSIAKLVNIIEKGGKVDFVPPDIEASDDDGSGGEIERLRERFEEVRQLENKLKRLGYFPETRRA